MDINLSKISTRNEFADLLGIPHGELTYVLYKKGIDNFYDNFDIPKKNGGIRHIKASFGTLKKIQKKLSLFLMKYQKDMRKEKNINNKISHAFEEGKGIITNAKVHRNKKYVINMDLDNFFDSFHFGRVRGYFEKNRNFKLDKKLSTVVAQLACYQGCLPQGAPSSPIITNLICEILDFHILKVAKNYKLNYTRYADDLIFSTNSKEILLKLEAFKKAIEEQVNNAGFKLNEDKFRIQFENYRQTVTGLTVNERVGVKKEFRKKTRAMLHSLYTKGEFKIDGEAGSIKQLKGRLSFINQLEENDSEKNHFHKLNGRELQYKKFIFYSLFFDNEKTIIITEGKTDVVYLKAALKNLYKNYPNLIERTNDGRFNFKIKFLKRTKTLESLFGLYVDGADAMKNVYSCFVGENSCSNYIEELKGVTGREPKNPVVMVFDHELDSGKKKPLREFLNYVGIIRGKKKLEDIKATPSIQELEEKLSLKLVDNLFLLTGSLMGESEADIEDLFQNKELDHTIKGKKFSKNDGYDKNKYYGKDIFSKYISSNYEKINFKNFKPMLNSLNEIVENYQGTNSN